MNSLFDRIAKFKIVPVIAVDSVEAAVPLADALVAGQLPIAEITFRTPAAASVIATIVRERPDVVVGAGTILTEDNLKAAIDAGATFGVAPGLNLRVVEVAHRCGFPFIPGVCTPTDVETALSIGCRVLKFFPAGAMGGLTMLKSLLGPYGHTGVRFLPTGGVNVDNLADYLATAGVLACGGTWIASKDDIAQGQWSLITARCAEAVYAAL